MSGNGVLLPIPDDPRFQAMIGRLACGLRLRVSSLRVATRVRGVSPQLLPAGQLPRSVADRKARCPVLAERRAGRTVTYRQVLVGVSLATRSVQRLPATTLPERIARADALVAGLRVMRMGDWHPVFPFLKDGPNVP